MSLAAVLTRAFALLQAGQVAQAETTLGPVMEAAGASGLHLLGLIRSAQGRLAEAEGLLSAALKIESRNHEIWANMGNLKRKMDSIDEAQSHYRQALALAPRFLPALRGLTRLLLEDGAFEQAEVLARSQLAAGDDGSAFALLSQALRGQRKPAAALEVCEQAMQQGVRAAPVLLEHAINLEKRSQIPAALRQYEALAASGLRDPALFINWASAEAARDDPETAAARLRDGLAHAPLDVGLHHALVHACAALGQPNPEGELLEALARQPGQYALLRLAATLLRQLERPERADPCFAAAKAAAPQDGWIDLAWAEHLDETGDPQQAIQLLVRAQASIAPTRHSLAVIAHAHLRTGSFETALRASEQLLRLCSHDQLGLAYAMTARRMLGMGQDSSALVRIYELPAPSGFDSLEDFNAALSKRLNAMHETASIPLGQSVRSGSQTAKSLLESEDPVILGFFEALAAPLQAYEAEMGAMGCSELAQRRTGRRRISGCWSIRLRPGGWHVNHVHPQGWVSSAYYVQTPDAPAREGWLKFGEPRYPIPGCGPDHWVQPQPGRLILFPSFLWHGVESFSRGGARLTIAFDAVPA